MTGRGVAHSAITVVNALPLGIGCAMGIDWTARAEVDLGAGGSAILSQDPSGTFEMSELVRTALALAHRRFAAPGTSVTHLRVESEVPVGKGLKSSSAVASAIGAAVADAAGLAHDPVAIARYSAEVGRASGTSATGAFDDALAGLRAGIVLTDNLHDRLLAAMDPPRGVEAVIWLPPGSHPAPPTLRERFSRARSRAEDAVERARNGDWARAMEINSELVDDVMGYDYRRVREDCQRHGAVAVGTSGLGPAVAAFAPPERLEAVARAFPPDRGTVRRARLVDAALATTGDGR